jgi:hypothetical protein
MKRLIIIAALVLTGCATKPTTIEKNHFVPVKVNEEFLDENKCPWPKKADHTTTGTDLDGSDWILAAYSSWLCEHETRMQIKKQNDQQAKDIEARNKK